jgi:hypothetical protein
MPVNDEEKLGRLRDHLATILVGMDARLQGLKIEQNMREKRHMIREVVSDTHNTLTSLDMTNKQQRTDHAAVLRELGASIEASFINLGLTEAQESFLSKTIKEAQTISDALYESGVNLDTEFQSIISRLTIAIESEIELDDPDDIASEAVTNNKDDSDSGTMFF